MLEVAVHEAPLVQGLEPSAHVQRDRASGEDPHKRRASGVGNLSVRVAACIGTVGVTSTLLCVVFAGGHNEARGSALQRLDVRPGAPL